MNYESKDKMVSHPFHYQSNKGIEVIDVIEAFTDGLNGIEAVDTGNAIKYICRWKDKNGIQDLHKAIWYITHLINHLEEKEKAEKLNALPAILDEALEALEKLPYNPSQVLYAKNPSPADLEEFFKSSTELRGN